MIAALFVAKGGAYDGLPDVVLADVLEPFGKRPDHVASALEGWARTRVSRLPAKRGAENLQEISVTLIHAEDVPLALARLSPRGMTETVKELHLRFLLRCRDALAALFYRPPAPAQQLDGSTLSSARIVDYLQLVVGKGQVGPRDNRELEMSAVAETLMHMAERLDVPVVALAQLNGDGEIRESKACLMHAQNWFDLQRSKKSKGWQPGEGEPASIRIRKQRHGPQDVSAPFWFHPQFVLFSDEERP